ncbi:MAG: sulfate adenylyltransferase [ANME-2 cluster archaeon]|nr:sulfate adenylyltransferase [ANME-2 cluster archaeon]
MSTGQIKPHGGKLINRVPDTEERDKLLTSIPGMPTIHISFDRAKEIENIASGLYSPLEGFLGQEDYNSVLESKRLANGLPWTIPIVLDISPEDAAKISAGDDVVLDHNELPVAILHVEEIFGFDRNTHSTSVFGTNDPKHPGVALTNNMNERLLGGKIDLLNEIETPYSRYALKPEETRAMFREKGWNTVAGFQTRNVPHLGHEYVQKSALTITDGLFINPVIGRKKSGDFRDDVILDSYTALLDNYFPHDRAAMSIFQTEMRYAGPREAIFHAIVRKNYGCTHFIVGRDHAGVGDYYHPFAAHEIFNEFDDLDIQPIFFRSFFYCKKCASIASDKTCPHSDKEIVNFSGTKMRDLLQSGQVPPPDLMREEVAQAILEYDNPFVE